MGMRGIVPAFRNPSGLSPDRAGHRIRQGYQALLSPNYLAQDESEATNNHRQAELFYLQKQIQSQTPMVIVLEDGEHVEGTIEWYDRQSLKVRGRARTLVYKSAIKYMYKLGDAGNGP